MKVIEEDEAKYTPLSINAAIQQYWEWKKERIVIKFLRQKITCLAFTITEAIFNNKKVLEVNTVAPKILLLIWKKSNKKHFCNYGSAINKKDNSSNNETSLKRSDNKRKINIFAQLVKAKITCIRNIFLSTARIKIRFLGRIETNSNKT